MPTLPPSAGDAVMQQYTRIMQVVQATFGGSVQGLGSKAYPLVVADPLTACTPIANTAPLKGAVALVQRGARCS